MLKENSNSTSRSAGYALVTGASRGIGRAIAMRLAQEGYSLYLTCRHSPNQLATLTEELIDQYGISCVPFIADMGNPSDVERIFAQIPSLSVLVNNAGISYIGLIHEMSVADWQEVMHTNLDAVFYTSRLAIPLIFAQSGGKIINISSVWGNVGASMEAPTLLQGRRQQLHPRSGKRTGSQRYSGQRHRLRCDRYRYEQMFFDGRYGDSAAGNTC